MKPDRRPGADAPMKSRFRGYLPVVLDVETGGFRPDLHAVLEIAAVTLAFDGGRLVASGRRRWAVAPHPDTALDDASLAITGIDPKDPSRAAVTEEQAVRELFRLVRREIKRHGCQRAIVAAHNAHFDHAFIHAAAARNGVKRNPFHPFSVLDTVGLAAVACGHTVLKEACLRMGIEFDPERAHGAAYDAEVTARLLCKIVNTRVSAGPWGRDSDGGC